MNRSAMYMLVCVGLAAAPAFGQLHLITGYSAPLAAPRPAEGMTWRGLTAACFALGTTVP